MVKTPSTVIRDRVLAGNHAASQPGGRSRMKMKLRMGLQTFQLQSVKLVLVIGAERNLCFSVVIILLQNVVASHLVLADVRMKIEADGV